MPGIIMLVALDFETHGILARPKFPPEPVGLAIAHGDTSAYYAWGHPKENNCTVDDVVAMVHELLEVATNEYVFHNAPFDVSVFEERLSIKWPWHKTHDTMLLAFLNDPYGELSLKPLCEKLLGMPPEEREAVREWLIAHGHCTRTDKSWGAHIAKAPGSLVGTYARGDVIRTLKLFEHLRKDFV